MLRFLGGVTACRSIYVEDSAAIKAFGNWLRHCGDKPRVSTVNRSVPSNGASSSSSSSHFWRYFPCNSIIYGSLLFCIVGNRLQWGPALQSVSSIYLVPFPCLIFVLFVYLRINEQSNVRNYFYFWSHHTNSFVFVCQNVLSEKPSRCHVMMVYLLWLNKMVLTTDWLLLIALN